MLLEKPRVGENVVAYEQDQLACRLLDPEIPGRSRSRAICGASPAPPGAGR